ncbi:MAG: dihydroorotate dehydrogenase electron transfer subunit [Bacteroidota bacterium]|nr:dihydroorotate dehydrogenase electron transfer subunit [Bacteroidota bacterium]
MIQVESLITHIDNPSENIFIFTINSPQIAAKAEPGQFLNIKVNDSTVPLLRRPFSVYHTNGEEVSIIFNIVGQGTKILSTKKVGDMLNIIGPLGNSFHIEEDYLTAVLVGGGLGVAPFPLLVKKLKVKNKRTITFLGARKADQVITNNLEDVKIATDDGSAGYHGTVVALVEQYLQSREIEKPKIYACGPVPMLNALADVIKLHQVECEMSLEVNMACGFGICQGCVIELSTPERKYALVCKDGPMFNSRIIKFPING